MPWLCAGVVFLVHAIGNARYGFFRDELYFIICGLHPRWGYVDQPPLVPLLAAVTQVFGHSLWLLRIVPALLAAGATYTTCLLVVEFGGGVFAQGLATLVSLFTLVLLSFGMKASTDEVNLLTWTLMALQLVRLTKGTDPRLWLAVGAVAGVTIESKYSVAFFLIALAAGLPLVGYEARLGELLHIPKSATATEHGRETSALPGDWADMHGWPEMASTIARIYDAPPPAQRRQAVHRTMGKPRASHSSSRTCRSLAGTTSGTCGVRADTAATS